MIDTIVSNPTALGVLLDVTYSLTEEPHLIREIGLHFSKAGVIFFAAKNELLAKRGRVCVPGLCMADEVCGIGTDIPTWRHFIQKPLAQAEWIESSVNRGKGLRLTFDIADLPLSVWVELAPEGNRIWQSRLDGANAWGGWAVAVPS